jgi:hypothetical protein
MSGLDQRTKARREALAPAVNDSSLLPDAAAWGEIPAEWLQHKSSDAARAAVPAFPLALLPQPWRDWAGDAARSSAAPVDYVVQAMLAAAAGLGGRRVLVIPTPGWQEPLRLWLAVVGLPSTGKSPALESVQYLLHALEETRAGSGVASPRRILLHERPFTRLADALSRDPRSMVLCGTASCPAWRHPPAPAACASSNLTG